MNNKHFIKNIPRTIKIFILISFVGLYSCYELTTPIEYNGPQYPLSVEGNNILTFLYNDNIWINETKYREEIGCTLSKYNEGLYKVRVNASSRFEKIIGVNFQFLIDENLEQVNEDSLTRAFFNFSGNNKCDDFNSVNKELIVNIVKLDTISRVISGQFFVPILENDCNERMVISKGRFDIKYSNF